MAFLGRLLQEVRLAAGPGHRSSVGSGTRKTMSTYRIMTVEYWMTGDLFREGVFYGQSTCDGVISGQALRRPTVRVGVPFDLGDDKLLLQEGARLSQSINE